MSEYNFDGKANLTENLKIFRFSPNKKPEAFTSGFPNPKKKNIISKHDVPELSEPHKR